MAIAGAPSSESVSGLAIWIDEDEEKEKKWAKPQKQKKQWIELVWFVTVIAS